MKKIQFVNNSEPYLSAENLNQMQSNIEDAIEWKLVGEVAGNNTVALPTSFKELYVVTTYTTENYSQTFTKNILKENLVNKQYIYTGYYYSDNDNAVASFFHDNNYFSCNALSIGGQSLTSSSTTRIYYR